MASNETLIPLEQALDFPPPNSNTCTIQLSDHPSFGQVSSGGYTTAVIHKIATLYASSQRGRPSLQRQTDVHVSTTHFHRPVVPSRGPVGIEIHEVSIGKAWSTLRVEVFQRDRSKVCATADLIVSNFSTAGVTLDTKWRLEPTPLAVDLARLETYSDPNWTCYHTAFYPNGFKRAHAYVKGFLPTHWSVDTPYVEQWIVPGWDCTATGSRDPSIREARWTNETIPFVMDNFQPILDNQRSRGQGNTERGYPVGSVPASLAFAASQKKARDHGRPNWRVLPNDGSASDGIKAFQATGSMAPATLCMTIEIKKKLPPEGVRWLMLRIETKSIRNGRMDYHVLCFDEHLDLVAIRNGVEQVLGAEVKNERQQNL